MGIIDVEAVSKTFKIPRVRRDTVREHVFDMFRPHPYELLRILDQITLEVAEGETIGIMGRNGCGKSTLLKIIAGIYVPDAGSVRVKAGLTALLELGVGWNGELDAVDNIYLLGAAIRQSEASTLLERHGVAAGLCGRVQSRETDSAARRNLRGR
jgi:ABC-type polysaccharide/polyol phosphate transport system ATPase subunit